MKHRRFFHLIRIIVFAIFLLLVAYVVYLLVSSYRSQTELRENLISQLKQDIEFRAASIGYFFSDQKDDVVNMKLNNRISDYFENKALGMSKEYGLNISLMQIRELFTDLMKRKQVEKDKIYSRIVLIDRTGAVLVNVSGADQHLSSPHKLKAFLSPAVRHGIITVSHDRTEFIISVPCYHKDKYAGQIVAWINPEIIAKLLLNVKSTAASIMFLAVQAGDRLLPVGVTPALPTLNLPALLSQTTGEIKEIETGGGGSMGRKMIALRVLVNETPFSLIRIVDERDVTGDLNPDKLLISMVIQAVFIFTGLFFTLGLMARHMILQTKLDESAIRERDISEKNRQLEIEIVERKRAEGVLLKAIEAAQVANRAKKLFLSNMSHEVRTPMNGVIGMARLLMDTPLTERQRDYAEKIMKSGESLLAIITNVVDYARTKAGKIKIINDYFSIEKVIENVVRIFSPPIAAKGLKLNTVLDRELPPLLLGDHEKVTRIISNMMDNAIKFTEKGEILLTVKISRWTEEQVELEISVQDTGIGIREGDLPRLFSAFSQADDTITRRYGGGGIGLASSRLLVELLGGMLRAESIHGKGSTFTAIISFPIVADGETNTYTEMDVKANSSVSVLDVEEGMKLFGGDMELYLQSLADFIIGYGETTSLLMKELRADRREETIFMIQAIQAVARKLGGKALDMAAAEFEKACRVLVNGVPFAVGEALRVFIDEHEAFVAAITAFISQQPLITPVKPQGPLGNVTELIPLLANLRIFLKNEEPQPSKEILATLLQKRWSDSYEAVLTELSLLVKRYRLAEALCLLDKEFYDILNNKEI